MLPHVLEDVHMCFPSLQDLAHHEPDLPHSGGPNGVKLISMTDIGSLGDSPDSLFDESPHLLPRQSSGQSLSTTQASSSLTDSLHQGLERISLMIVYYNTNALTSQQKW